GNESGYIINQASRSLINYSYIDTLDWYVLDKIPINILFHKLQVLRQNYFLMFSLFMVTFIFIAFLISFTITSPLSHMQKKMRVAVSNDLKTRLPEHKYKGEVLELARTFNTMLSDTSELI